MTTLVALRRTSSKTQPINPIQQSCKRCLLLSSLRKDVLELHLNDTRIVIGFLENAPELHQVQNAFALNDVVQLVQAIRGACSLQSQRIPRNIARLQRLPNRKATITQANWNIRQSDLQVKK